MIKMLLGYFPPKNFTERFSSFQNILKKEIMNGNFHIAMKLRIVFEEEPWDALSGCLVCLVGCGQGTSRTPPCCRVSGRFMPEGEEGKASRYKSPIAQKFLLG